MKPADQYRAYLAERAGNGDADALAELRRQRSPQRAPTGERIEHQTGQQPEAAPIMKPATYKVDQQGNVTYYDKQKQAMACASPLPSSARISACVAVPRNTTT
ncbi:hypothetical protein G6F46_014372 [Rhizopus delemar]|nr:hypothetical protein G6F46_014372 [Rhizopus delemar]